MLTIAPTLADYGRAFEAESRQQYPAIDAVEAGYGFALDRTRLEAAALVLACPVKAHAPNWQHGRVLYAATRRYLADHQQDAVTLLDIGTAKGFSALCLYWALSDAGAYGAVVSVDVIDPKARVRRNTIAEVDGEKTLADILAPWPESAAITFLKSTGLAWLQHRHARVNVAFVDGKHQGATVYAEGERLATYQEPGDLAIFDDVQIDGVGLAVQSLAKYYTLQYVAPLSERIYAIGVRR